ncbi:glycine zipper 2TM domain-containing protein [Agrobacterium tumefaciens]|uniref:glycine zipper 2TM domain-containing protein n=1 Tax=Agrobacterium tumefaciens TaxID=358 RepID=UPI001B8A1D6A
MSLQKKPVRHTLFYKYSIGVIALFALAATLPVSAYAQDMSIINGQNVGAVGGAVAGGVVGRKLGGKKHKTLGTVAGALGGAVVGGVAGRMIEGNNNRPTAQAPQYQPTPVYDPQPTGSISNEGGNGLINGKNVGAVGGAIAGGIAGNKLGGKKHKTIGTVLGIVGGAVAGGAVGNAVAPQ